MEEDLLKMIRIRPIEAADDPHMARLVRESLRRHGLDIPGTAYFDPELDHLSAHYALRPDRRAYFIAEGPAGRVLGGAGIGELGGYPDCAELQKIYVARPSACTRRWDTAVWRIPSPPSTARWIISISKNSEQGLPLFFYASCCPYGDNIVYYVIFLMRTVR